MYDNSNLAIRCRALWADVLCAVESRVWSINDYVHDSRSHLDCHMLNSDSVQIEHPSGRRTLIATLDLDEHAIFINEFTEGTLSVGSKLPFAMLGDGNVYVTSGQSLMGDPMAVARQLMAVLLSNSDESSSTTQIDEYRSWASALMTARARRTPIKLAIEIQTENSVYPASTLDLSTIGAKVQSSTAKLERGNYVTIFRGTLGSFFRVVWAEKAEQGTRAGLVCLNPPLEWAEDVIQ